MVDFKPELLLFDGRHCYYQHVAYPTNLPYREVASGPRMIAHIHDARRKADDRPGFSETCRHRPCLRPPLAESEGQGCTFGYFIVIDQLTRTKDRMGGTVLAGDMGQEEAPPRITAWERSLPRVGIGTLGDFRSSSLWRRIDKVG